VVAVIGLERPFFSTARALTFACARSSSIFNTRLLFPATGGGYVDLHDWRAGEWVPAVDAAGLGGRRIYDLRHSFASHALAAGLGIYELARYMGTSLEQIDKTYGHLVVGAEGVARAKLDAYAERLARERPAADTSGP
jgi:integrase